MSPSSRARRDSGVSFVELLVAIVLLGTAVVGILAAVRATIIGSSIEQEHSRAHQWLQSASEVLVNDVAWRDCETNTAAALQATYQSSLRGETDIVPSAWTNTQLSVPTLVLFGQTDGEYDAACHPEIDRQLVRIQVVDSENKIIESVDVVKVP